MKTRVRIELAKIDDNPYQPRLEYDQEAIEDLADSIEQLDVLQIPLARPRDDGRVQLAFGHRRNRSCWHLAKQERSCVAVELGNDGPGSATVELDLEDLSDERMAVIALTENVQRKDLSQMETLRAYRRAIDETELTGRSLAQQLQIAESTLSNNLRVLDLPDFILEHVETGKLGITVAREFLVLQNAHHSHHQEMRAVVTNIVNEETYGGRPPNWQRKNVRKRISERISFQQNNGFRPIGPKTGHEVGGANREPTFDTDAFSFEFADCLHTIPADDGRSENYRALELYDKSRVWTCEVREWSRRQSRATREANAQAAVSGGGKAAGGNSPKAPSRDKVFEALLGVDPVWQEIDFSREKPGPNRPVNDDERERLGTRAEFRDLDHYNPKFWKVLDRGDTENIYELERLDGGLVPPWFPDLKECRRCTIGAAYAKSNGGYPPRKPALVCFNKEHYLEKLARGEAAYRENLQANILGMNRQDEKAAARSRTQIEPLSDDACRALAVSLISAKRGLDLEHPMGRFHENWSYESATVVRVRELLGVEAPSVDRWNRSGPVMDVDAVGAISADDVRKLVALLMTHHLRVAGKLDELMPTRREEPAAETKRCTRCGQDKPLDAFGQQKKHRSDGVKMIPKSKCKQCLVDEELERRGTSAATVASRNFGQRQEVTA